MAFDTYTTAFGGKPAQVNVNGADIEVQLGGRTGAIWKLAKDLTPIEYSFASGVIPAEFKKDEASGQLTRCRTEAQDWQPVTPATDKELATFANALAMIDAVSSTPGFPADVKAKLPEAHKALGFEYATGQRRA